MASQPLTEDAGRNLAKNSILIHFAARLFDLALGDTRAVSSRVARAAPLMR